MRSRFQDAAREIPHGNKAAYVFSVLMKMIMVPLKLTGVPSLKKAPLAPLGPSVVLIEGIPFEGMVDVLQKSWAASRDTSRC